MSRPGDRTGRLTSEEQGVPRDEGRNLSASKINAPCSALVNPAGIAAKQEAFAQLIAAMGGYHDAGNEPPSMDVEAFGEVQDVIAMLDSNLDDDGSLAMLQNTADLINAAHRLAAVLLADVTAEHIRQAAAEYLP